MYAFIALSRFYAPTLFCWPLSDIHSVKFIKYAESCTLCALDAPLNSTEVVSVSMNSQYLRVVKYKGNTQGEVKTF